jgi:hypothetical protein
MNHSGFKWSLKPEGDHWRWKAIGRDTEDVVVEGVARTRAEAAAYLARTMSLAVIGDASQIAA